MTEMSPITIVGRINKSLLHVMAFFPLPDRASKREPWARQTSIFARIKVHHNLRSMWARIGLDEPSR